jgi:hypothetical protein
VCVCVRSRLSPWVLLEHASGTWLHFGSEFDIFHGAGNRLFWEFGRPRGALETPQKGRGLRPHLSEGFSGPPGPPRPPKWQSLRHSIILDQAKVQPRVVVASMMDMAKWSSGFKAFIKDQSLNRGMTIDYPRAGEELRSATVHRRT